MTKKSKLKDMKSTVLPTGGRQVYGLPCNVVIVVVQVIQQQSN